MPPWGFGSVGMPTRLKAAHAKCRMEEIEMLALPGSPAALVALVAAGSIAACASPVPRRKSRCERISSSPSASRHRCAPA